MAMASMIVPDQPDKNAATDDERRGLTPAEQRAQREGMPVVLLVPFECLHIAAGNPMITRLQDGREALVRLFTEDEFYAAHLAACEGTGTPPSTYEAVAHIARPIGGES
jgi:hypothetical protein